MGLIKEPEGVDFIIESTQLTDKERIEISEFIRITKQQNKSKGTKPISKKRLKHDVVKKLNA